DVFSENRPGSPGTAAIEEKHQARGRTGPRADRPSAYVARNHRAGGKAEPHASRVGELLLSRHRQSGISGARQLCGCAVASVVAFQAQDQTKQGRQLSTLAPLRDLWARASDPAWARRAVGEGVRVLSESRMQGNPHVRFDERDVETGAMVEPLRHRQTKGAATDMPGLPPPRHIPTLPHLGR